MESTMSNAPDRSGLAEELRELLIEERRLLLGGSPETLQEVVRRKLVLAEAIERAPQEPPVPLETVAALDRYNRENAIICGTMLRHLTEALDTLRQQNGLHRSYKLDGTEERNSAAPQILGAA
jgi:flagellar biosynthesis/type III secretory pathway chaperone